jgi:hypothetical protein
LPEASTATTAKRPSGMSTMQHSMGLAIASRPSPAQAARRRTFAATNSR